MVETPGALALSAGCASIFPAQRRISGVQATPVGWPASTKGGRLRARQQLDPGATGTQRCGLAVGAEQLDRGFDAAAPAPGAEDQLAVAQQPGTPAAGQDRVWSAVAQHA